MAKRSQQTKDREYKQMVHKLQDQVRTLELSLAGHATLPSLKHTQKEADLWEEVFNYLPGTVNNKRGVAMCMIPRISLFPSGNMFDLGTGLKCLI